MTTETKSGLATKLAAAMGEIGRVQKRGKNQAQGYSYARADDVAEEARAVLSKHGVAIFASVENKGIREFAGKNGPVRVSMVDVAWTFKDGDTGEEKTVHVPGEGSDFGDKGIYKAMTGSLKYALMLGFLIPTGDGDPERDEEDEPRTARRQAPRQAVARTAPVAPAPPPPEPESAPTAAIAKEDAVDVLAKARDEYAAEMLQPVTPEEVKKTWDRLLMERDGNQSEAAADWKEAAIRVFGARYPDPKKWSRAQMRDVEQHLFPPPEPNDIAF